MNNYDLSRMIIDDVMKKVNSGGPVFYMEYVRSVETILNKYAAQQSAQDGEGEEIDPVAQALRNLGDAIAPPRR